MVAGVAADWVAGMTGRHIHGHGVISAADLDGQAGSGLIAIGVGECVAEHFVRDLTISQPLRGRAGVVQCVGVAAVGVDFQRTVLAVHLDGCACDRTDTAIGHMAANRHFARLHAGHLGAVCTRGVSHVRACRARAHATDHVAGCGIDRRIFGDGVDVAVC